MKMTLAATPRETKPGASASRRLRKEGLVPAILYGDETAPALLTVQAKDLIKNLNIEAFYSSIITLDIAGQKQPAILRALQRDVVQSTKILHADFQRVNPTKPFRKSVGLHFINEEIAPGVKEQAGVISHAMSHIEIKCLPEFLPEFITVDVGHLKLNEAIHLRELILPKNVSFAHDNQDQVVVGVYPPKAAEVDTGAPMAPVEVGSTKVKKADAAATVGKDSKKDGPKNDKKDMKKAKDKK